MHGDRGPEASTSKFSVHDNVFKVYQCLSILSGNSLFLRDQGHSHELPHAPDQEEEELNSVEHLVDGLLLDHQRAKIHQVARADDKSVEPV